MSTTTNLHTTLALFSIIGLLGDSLVGFDVVVPFATTIAIICFAIGPLLIAWAQNTSSKRKQQGDDKQHAYFNYGPYRYMRNPTHLGLVILVTGYAVISGSIIFLSITVLGYIISNMLFKKYESIVIEKYGDHYEQYKSDVPKIL
jgi:protein-S-isoprenylcysteine O-methyltransferase Ste14